MLPMYLVVRSSPFRLIPLTTNRPPFQPASWPLRREADNFTLDAELDQTTGWDLDADAPTGWAEVPVGVPVVLEGVSATDAAVPVPWDVRLWVAVPAAVRRRRIERRDADRLDVWRDDWWPAEQAYARAQQPWRRADAIVRGGLA